MARGVMKTDFEFILTDDGSPSIRLTYSSGVSERMHHFSGAFTESIYIYHTAVARTC